MDHGWNRDPVFSLIEKKVLVAGSNQAGMLSGKLTQFSKPSLKITGSPPI
jgi:hypothetical protein